jgi:hypothetical protein
MELLYEVGAKKGEHHVAAAEDDHAELEELDRDLAQPWSSGGV